MQSPFYSEPILPGSARIGTEPPAGGRSGETAMNGKVFVPAVAAGILALAMSGSAMAAGTGGGHSRELVMQAGTDPNSIQVHFAGAQKVTVAPGGLLEILDADGVI